MDFCRWSPRPVTLTVAAAEKAVQAGRLVGRQTGEVQGLLLSGDLRSLSGDGVLDSLQLFQQFLTT